MIRVPVAVPGREYEVVVGAGILDEAERFLPHLEGRDKAFIVADTTVARVPAPRNLDLWTFLTATETPYIGLGAASLLVLLTALVLQVRRGREK